MSTYTTSSLQHNREAGVVSIFIVIFFMIFISVISIGFIKVVNDDQIQSTDNDLSASALASARSGAEEGKRLLLLCRTKASTNPTLKAACDTALASNSCSALTGNTTLTSALKINVDNTGGRTDGIVSNNNAYEQRYTCMTIKTQTDSVEGIQVKKATSELIPLKGTSAFDTLRFSWHATAEDRDKALTAFRAGIDLPAENMWSNGSSSYAAAMRLEVVWFPKGNINLNDIEAASRTVFVLPGDTSAASGAPINLSSADVRTADPNSPNTESRPRLARCQGGLEYACQVDLQFAGLPSSATNDYFLKVSAIYGSAYIKTELRSGTNIVPFDGVQPLIDVTGRANDVFRRIQTRVQFNSVAFYPHYALAVGELCKNMLVTNSTSTSSDLCFPGGLVGGAILGEAEIGGADPNGTGGGTTNPDTRPCTERFSWTDPICYRVRPYNYSQIAPGTLARCEWHWGDGRVDVYDASHVNCKYGTRVVHEYKNPSPVGVWNTYTYFLRNVMVDTTPYDSKSVTERIPY